MTLTNFLISKDLIGVERQDEYFDLHNCYDFLGTERSENSEELVFKFGALDEEWVPENSPAQIFIVFRNVKLFDSWETKSDFPSEKSTLEELGFYLNSTSGRVEYNGVPEPFDEGNLLVFRFLDGKNYAVEADSAECLVKAHNNQINKDGPQCGPLYY